MLAFIYRVFSGYIHDSSNILYAEFYVIFKGLILAKSLNITELVCYSESSHCINLLKCPTTKFHVYVVLIQDVMHLIKKNNVVIFYTLREVNHCANFMIKLRASLDTKLF